jgi:hypothetical protein
MTREHLGHGIWEASSASCVDDSIMDEFMVDIPVYTRDVFGKRISFVFCCAVNTKTVLHRVG